MLNILRNASNSARLSLISRNGVPLTLRSFHSPFALLSKQTGSSPLTAPPSSDSTVTPIYEKQSDHSPEPQISHSGTRTYVVTEPEPSNKHYDVPAGAFPTSAPYVNFSATKAPDTHGAQVSSTSSDILAHTQTRSADQHDGGVGESAAVRNAEAPGELLKKGGSHGGLGMMDKAQTKKGDGKLAGRNPPPLGETAEKFSKLGIDDAWKARK